MWERITGKSKPRKKTRYEWITRIEYKYNDVIEILRFLFSFWEIIIWKNTYVVE